jgi:hypothetical protein
MLDFLLPTPFRRGAGGEVQTGWRRGVSLEIRTVPAGGSSFTSSLRSPVSSLEKETLPLTAAAPVHVRMEPRQAMGKAR